MRSICKAEATIIYANLPRVALLLISETLHHSKSMSLKSVVWFLKVRSTFPDLCSIEILPNLFFIVFFRFSESNLRYVKRLDQYLWAIRKLFVYCLNHDPPPMHSVGRFWGIGITATYTFRNETNNSSASFAPPLRLDFF